MFLGAYWGPREETREQAATRLSVLVDRFAKSERTLDGWMLKASTKTKARRPLGSTAEEIAQHLAQQKREVGPRTIIPELGFQVSVWNGGGISLSANIGCAIPAVPNSVLLEFHRPVPESFNLAVLRNLLDSVIEVLDPDSAAVTSSRCLNDRGARTPADAGVFTFSRNQPIREDRTCLQYIEMQS